MVEPLPGVSQQGAAIIAQSIGAVAVVLAAIDFNHFAYYQFLSLYTGHIRCKNNTNFFFSGKQSRAGTKTGFWNAAELL